MYKHDCLLMMITFHPDQALYKQLFQALDRLLQSQFLYGNFLLHPYILPQSLQYVPHHNRFGIHIQYVFYLVLLPRSAYRRHNQNDLSFHLDG